MLYWAEKKQTHKYGKQCYTAVSEAEEPPILQ